MRSIRATHNVLAVSANKKETFINKEQTLDTTMLVALSDIINLEPRRESNVDEATGKEEPDTIYDLGSLAGLTMNFEKAQPQHFAFLLAHALGAISTGAAGTGWEHTITPIADDEDADRSNPSFTCAGRFGKTVVKRRFASFFVDSTTVTLAKDAWCKIVGTIKGTGKVEDNMYEETVNALDDAVSLTLAANGVEGATPAARLDNVHRIRITLTAGVWTEVEYSVVSDATPAVITITSPGGASALKDYKILYVPAVIAPSDWVTETAYSLDEECKPTVLNEYWYKCIVGGTSAVVEPVWPTTIGGTIVDGTVTWECITDDWMIFPSRVSQTPMRIAETIFKLGGKWNGSAFEGGRQMGSEINSVEWSFNNNTVVEFAPGAGGVYASRAFRNGRAQTIKVNREFREYILQQHIDANDTFGFHILAEGAIYDTPHKYQVEIIFPLVGVLTAPLSVDGKKVAEAGDLQVLEDTTYGSVVVKVKDKVATYMA